MTDARRDRFAIAKGEEAAQKITERLDAAGWQVKREPFLRHLVSIEHAHDRETRPQISVVVISWRLHHDTEACFERLELQRDQRFELIFVDNGAGPEEFLPLRPYCDVYLRLDTNTGAYLARNLGAAFATAPVILFLEDDGLPAPDLLAAHLEAYRLYRCISVRGVYSPKTDNPLNALARHYDLGDQPFPQYVVAEGNASYDATAFFAVSGWDDEIRFGGGGLELARRLTDLYPDLRQQIYFPKAVIYHDYARDQEHLDKKRAAQLGSFERLEQKHPDLRIFRYVWRKFVNRPDLLLPKAEAPETGRNHSTQRPEHPPQRVAAAVPEPLESALAAKGWTPRPALVAAWLAAAVHRTVTAPAISVVITQTSGRANAGDALARLVTLRSAAPWELVVVAPEAGPGAEAAGADVVVRVRPKTSTYVSRNLGALYARAPVLLFLHGDGLPAPDLVNAHLAEHRDLEVVAVQGVVRRRDAPSSASRRAGHYVLGDTRFPIFSDSDDNTSYESRTFFSVGGWDDEADFGGTGFELARRITAIEPDLRKQIYSPHPVVERDEAVDEEELTRKHRAFERSVERLKERIPDYDAFMSSWITLEGRPEFVVPAARGRSERCARRFLARFQEEPDYPRCLARLHGLLEHFPLATAAFYPISLGRFIELSGSDEDRAPTDSSAPQALGPDPCACFEPPLRSDLSFLRRSFRRLPWFWSLEETDHPEGLSVFCLATYSRSLE